jgi:hypothetical protein
MMLGGYKTEGVKRFQVTPVLVADGVAAHGNDTVEVVKTYYYDDESNNFRHTLELQIVMEQCRFSLLD